VNREKAAELWPIIKAYAEGAEVEYRGPATGWMVLNEPLFYSACEFRIKIKPREGDDEPNKKS